MFLDAYNKLLHDIKPKLTGNKTNEIGETYGNGVFKNPWIENYDFQDDCNDLLKLIQKLISDN